VKFHGGAGRARRSNGDAWHRREKKLEKDKTAVAGRRQAGSQVAAGRACPARIIQWRAASSERPAHRAGGDTGNGQEHRTRRPRGAARAGRRLFLISSRAECGHEQGSARPTQPFVDKVRGKVQETWSHHIITVVLMIV
jgi:hypothetical protein